MPEVALVACRAGEAQGLQDVLLPPDVHMSICPAVPRDQLQHCPCLRGARTALLHTSLGTPALLAVPQFLLLEWRNECSHTGVWFGTSEQEQHPEIPAKAHRGLLGSQARR